MAPMTREDSQVESGERFQSPFDLLEGTSESTRAKTAETFLELLGARVRNSNTRSAYRVAWRSFLTFCSARQLELENVKAYHVGAWLDQHPGSRATAKKHFGKMEEGSRVMKPQNEQHGFPLQNDSHGIQRQWPRQVCGDGGYAVGDAEIPQISDALSVTWRITLSMILAPHCFQHLLKLSGGSDW